MSKSTLIVMVLAFILSLTGCGSSSLLESTKPPPEAIKLVNEDKDINESFSKSIIIKHLGEEVELEDKDIKITYKKVPISDADKFNGISEEWSLVHEYQTRYRIKSKFNAPVGVKLDEWSKWSEWYSETKKSKLSKEKGEWKINKELANTFKTYPRPK
jgi:hypothetical protein